MKISRIDIIATNGNDGLHYKEKRMRKPFEYTAEESTAISNAYYSILETLATITDEKRRNKCVRVVAAKLSESVRKPRLPLVDPNQMSFEDKLVMEETLRGPDYPEEGDAA